MLCEQWFYFVTVVPYILRGLYFQVLFICIIIVKNQISSVKFIGISLRFIGQEIPDSESEWSSHHGSVETNLTSIHEEAGLIPGLTLLVKDPVCCELWCRSKMRLGSGVAVV